MIVRGTADFRRVSLALFVGNFVIFVTLYSVQPLLPTFATEFHVTPAVSSLALSVTTASLAVFMVVIGSLSEAAGRKWIMVAALVLSSLLDLLAATSTDFGLLLGARTLIGMLAAGLPPLAMAYLGEEIAPAALGLAMGIFVSAASFGGMIGRIVISLVADHLGWRASLASVGLIGLAGAAWVWWSLPRSAHFDRRRLELAPLSRSLLRHLRDRRLLCLYGIGFLLLGSFVSFYNYLIFQITAPPYSLSQTAVGWLFLVYLSGTFSSTLIGDLTDRLTPSVVLAICVAVMLAGAAVTLGDSLALKITGAVVFTFGFYGAHSVASGWVGRWAASDRAQASSLYLFFYYLGSSVFGFSGGLAWSAGGWRAVIATITTLLVLTLLLVGALRRRERRGLS